MDTTITGVAAIIGVYALVLALSIWPAARVRVGPWGFVLFAPRVAGLRHRGLARGAARLPRAAGRRRRRRADRGLRAAGRGPIALRPPPLARRRADRHRRRPGDRRSPDRGLRLARDLHRPGPAGRRGGARVRAPSAGDGARRGERPGGARPTTRPRRAACGRAAEPPASPRPSRAIRDAARRRRRASSPAACDGRLRRRAARDAVSPVWLAALAFTAAAFTAVLFLLVIELVAGFAMSPIEAALGRHRAAAGGARVARRSAARSGRRRWRARC